jgi:signal transduction histidine kinase
MAVLAVGYFVTAKLGLSFPSVGNVSAVWPAGGVAVAGLLLLGRKAWPGIAIGGFLGGLSIGLSPATVAGIALGQTLAPLAAASLLEAFRFNTALSRLRDVLVLIISGGAAAMLVSAPMGVAILTAAGNVSEGQMALAWLAWSVGDATGMILVAPLLLTLHTVVRSGASRLRAQGAEATTLLVATAVASRLLFNSDLPLIFLVFPFVLWGALRFGVLGAATVNVLVAGVAVWATVEGHGPFSQLSPAVSLVVLQAFNASVAITCLILAVITHERRQAFEEVRASRVRIVEAGDAERCKVERNLHDGAQQRLVSLSLSLRLAQARVDDSPDRELQTILARASEELQLALSELRELARGIHPTILAREGLDAAVKSLAEQAPIPVEVLCPSQRYPQTIEATAYFMVCEALTNVAKHARASAARVSVEEADGRLMVEVTDDGVGGADPAAGSGLRGLADRLAAFGGQLRVESPPGRGTRIRAELPYG